MKSETLTMHHTVSCHFCQQQRRGCNVRRLKIDLIDRWMWLQLCRFCLANELQALKDETG